MAKEPRVPLTSEVVDGRESQDESWLEGWWDGTSTANESLERIESRSRPYREGFRQGLVSGATPDAAREEDSKMRTKVMSRRAFAAATLASLAAVLAYGWMRPGIAEATPPSPPAVWQNVTLPNTINHMDRLHARLVQNMTGLGPVAFKAHVIATFDAASVPEKGFVTNWIQEQGATICPDVLIDFVDHTIGNTDAQIACEGAAVTLAELSGTSTSAFPAGSKARVGNLMSQAPTEQIFALLEIAYANLVN